MRFDAARTRFITAFSVSTALVAATVIGRADTPPRSEAPRATATCERIAGPGRVKCEAEVIAPAGQTVQWADAVIVETPAFVSALKGRIGPADATAREKDRWRFGFGLVARTRGTGDVKLNVRAVICRPSLSFGSSGDPPSLSSGSSGDRPSLSSGSSGDRPSLSAARPASCEARLMPLVVAIAAGQ